MKTEDGRESLINELCGYLMPKLADAGEARDMLYIICNNYEITSRCTELAETGQEQNERLLKRFLVAKAVKGCSDRTIKAYAYNIRRILDGIGKPAGDIQADDIRYYLALRQRRDRVTKSTADNELRFLKSFYQYLAAEELVDRNPAARVDCVKCDRKKKEAFTDIEVEKIRMSVNGEKEKAIVEILLSTGCRVSELTQIQLGDIEGNRIVVHGKGAKDRNVYLNAKAKVAVDAYLAKRQDGSPYLFPGTSREGTERQRDAGHIGTGTVEGMVRELAKRAGIKRAYPHKFRRTCATFALRHGMPVEQVSKMLGHEKLTTTQIYLDLSESELEQAHRKYVV